MYNKIASIILNSGKAVGLSDVYVAQPETLKENLAGKVFLLAEISGKKSEARKIFDFLILALQDSYYNDEKIMLRGKIEGLKIENIFEAALAKINKSLSDFLLEEKIKLNTAATNLTIGVIYENKLHFANFGRNRALLLYRHGEHYEIINVEVNATEASPAANDDEATSIKTPQLFSSVISGEIPQDSYFIFTSETMPEYLSGQDMLDIVTKLPPITAAEQIKNVLAKINVYVPFLGIIIKNTMGAGGSEVKEEPEEVLSAHSSISSLNYTEQKTEEMLASAGLINLPHLFKRIKKTIKSWQPVKSKQRSFRSDRPEQPDRSIKTEEKNITQPVLNLGTVKSMNLARADSFLMKDKIFFKKNPGRLLNGLKSFWSGLSSLFGFRFFAGWRGKINRWLASVSLKKRSLYLILGGVTLILVISIIIGTSNHNHKLAQENFNNIVAQINEQKILVESRLSYGNDDGARTALLAQQALVSSLPAKTKAEIAAAAPYLADLHTQEERVQKISRVTAVKVNDLSGLGIKNLIFTGDAALGSIFGAGDKFIYGLKPDSASSSKIEIVEAVNLTKPQYDTKTATLYYWDSTKQIIQYNLKTKSRLTISLPVLAAPDDLAGYKIFNNNLYSVDKTKSQVYRFQRAQTGYAAPTDWLKEPADLSQATDLFVDGSVYVLKLSGQVLKFYTGKAVNFNSAALSPVMTGANKIMVGNKYIYVFEPSSKRLAVLAKEDGHLMEQYVADSLNQPVDFAVDEVGRSAYFLDGEAIYKITLNQ